MFSGHKLTANSGESHANEEEVSRFNTWPTMAFTRQHQLPVSPSRKHRMKSENLAQT